LTERVSSTTRRELLGLGAGAAAGMALGCSAGEEAHVEQRPPNLLLLFPDQHRFDWIGATSGIAVRTPNLDRLADRGTRFTNAICASPLCAPSRACLASGKEYDQAGVADNSVNYPLDQTTYYTLLRQAGYHVMGCGKFDLHKPDPSWGIDGQHLIDEWGFTAGIDSAGKWDAWRSGRDEPKDPYMYYLHTHDLAATHVGDFDKRREVGSFLATFPTPLPDTAYCDNWIANSGLDLLREAPAGKPWHLVVNWAGPHEPVDITGNMVPWYRGASFPQPNGNTQHPAEKHVEIRRNYSAMIENIDRWVGRFLEEVELRGELDNTLVVFSSDHGEMLGDHNLWAKRHPHQPSVGVPLVAAGPGTAPGVVSDAPVSVVDIAATFLDYAGLSVPGEMDSRSFRPLLEGRTRSHREFVLSGMDPWRAIFDGRYKLIRGYTPGMRMSGSGLPAYREKKDLPPLLFDLREDPLEDRNIAAEAPAEVQRLTELLHGSVEA